MIYAVSDLHGCYEKYKKLLDVIPIGDGGIDILLDMMSRANVRPLIGNHEWFALKVMKRIAVGLLDAELTGRTEAGIIWLLSGGEPTLRAFCTLGRESRKAVVDYIESFGIYDEITVNGRRFHLSHSLPDYDPNTPIHDVGISKFLFGEPDYTKAYEKDTLFVTGHTPTGLIDPAYVGRIWQKNNHIAIDCGAVFGNPLGCICLDTMEEIYAK